MAAYRVQERHYDTMKQWNAGRYGWQTRVRYSPWKTVYSATSFEEAKKHLSQLSQTGLKEYRIRWGMTTVWEVA